MIQLPIALFDSLASIILLAYLFVNYKKQNLHYLVKLAVWVGAIGLIWQAVISGVFVVTGEFFLDEEFPLWALKDVGYWVIAVYIVKRFVKK